MNKYIWGYKNHKKDFAEELDRLLKEKRKKAAREQLEKLKKHWFGSNDKPSYEKEKDKLDI